MLFGPEEFHSIAQADVQYTNLSTATWANGDTTIEYTYDVNGSVISKTTKVTSTQAVKETVIYNYNLQNRLAQIVRQYDDAGDKIEEFTEYTYNDNGIRIIKHTWSEINDTHQADDLTIVYLVDEYNHTGYTQTLEEKTYNGTDTSGVPDSLTTYLIGDDVIAQSTNGETQYLLYDGHGSTRQLAEYDGSVTIAKSYSYDGYGVLLQDDSVASANPGKVSQQATSLLYAGEHFDSDAQQYYLRARWYNPYAGLFNRTDPFSGDTEDPQSLHKYLYCYANPINAADLSGYGIGTFVEVCSVVSIIATMLSIFIPVATGVIVAVKQGVSPLEYLSELFSLATWKEAAIALGVGTAVGALIKPAIKQLGRRVLAFIGVVFSIWSLISSIRLSWKMALNKDISRAEIAHYLGVLTASVILAVVLGRIARHISKMRDKGYNRPYMRKKLREEIINNAKKTADGSYVDANTGKVIEGKYQFGHTYGNEHRRLVKEALGRSMTQKEFNDWVNSHAEWFQIEDPVGNMGHEFEKPGP